MCLLYGREIESLILGDFCGLARCLPLLQPDFLFHLEPLRRFLPDRLAATDQIERQLPLLLCGHRFFRGGQIGCVNGLTMFKQELDT